MITVGGQLNSGPASSIASTSHLLQNRVQSAVESIASFLGVSQKHVGVVLVEQRVVNGGVSDTKRSLHDNGLLSVPDSENGHSGDGTVGVVFGGRVHGVVGSKNDRHVNVVKFFVDLIELQHDVIWHTSFGEE